MNRHLHPVASWGLALSFVAFASFQMESTSRSQTQMMPPMSPQQKAATKKPTTYACPMHPEIKSIKRGKCPKCKMDLQPVRESVNMSVPIDVSDAVPETSKKLTIPDVEVLDQEGRTLHFYSDLVKGKTVVINFIFTNCTTICPPLAATFARVQQEMGDKVGKDVYFISISVDPLTDTPERLKAWGSKFKAGTGWTFVTGNKPEVNRLLNALGASVARREDHTPSILVGNDVKDVWTRTYGLARVSQVVGLIENVIAGTVDDPQTAKESAKP